MSDAQILHFFGGKGGVGKTTLSLAFALVTASLALPRPALAVYLLDYGDQIAIQVKDFPQYSYSGAIRPDGMIAIPFVGDVEVTGRTT